MNNEVALLLTIYCAGAEEVLHIAVKFERGIIRHKVLENPMDAENKQRIHDLLPEYLQLIGPIVEVRTLYDIDIVSV